MDKQEKPDITIVSNNKDWEGLYVNGELIEAGHNLRAVQLLEALEYLDLIKPKESYLLEVDSDWLKEDGVIPERLCDVKLKQQTKDIYNGSDGKIS